MSDEFELPEWGVVAQMGRKEHVGKIKSGLLLGQRVIRVQFFRPGEQEPFGHVFVAPDSLYGVQPMSEESCRKAHAPWEPPKMPQLGTSAHADSMRSGNSDPFGDEGDQDEDDVPDSGRDPGFDTSMSEVTGEAHDLLDKLGYEAGTIADRVKAAVLECEIGRRLRAYLDNSVKEIMGALGDSAHDVTNSDIHKAEEIFGNIDPNNVLLIADLRTILSSLKERSGAAAAQ